MLSSPFCGLAVDVFFLPEFITCYEVFALELVGSLVADLMLERCHVEHDLTPFRLYEIVSVKKVFVQRVGKQRFSYMIPWRLL